MPSPKKLVAGAAGVTLTLSGLALVAPSASADVTTKVTVPYTQDWSDAGLITANDDWSGVTGVQGYLGDYDSGSPVNVDPQTLTAESLGATDVIANNTATSLGGQSAGGVLESEGFGAIALQGSGTADAPNVVFHLDLTGQSGVSFNFDARDIDDQASVATQQLAVQYRVGDSGDFTNLPAGYLANAAAAGATQSTPVSVELPAAADGAEDVYVRVLTTNATGSDEWIGIDNISVGDGPAALSAADPSVPELAVDEPMAPVQLTATGGASPYTWEITGGSLPGGLSLSSTGELSGTPDATGSFSATATVTDDEGATDTAEIAITVVEGATAVDIADVQGTPATQGANAASPLVGQDVLVEGVVTGVFADPYDAEPGMANYGGLDGFYLQTAGTGGTTDATAEASDALFVYTGNDLPAGLEIGDSVSVEGTVQENFGTTRLTGPEVAELDTPLAEVTPLEIAYPTTEAGREAQEGMLLAPTDTFTVTNSYGTNQYGEVGLATGETPLLQPSDVALPGTPAFDDVVADNLARGVVLDDGTSINYLSNGSAQQDFPLPWLTATNSVRVGAEATLTGPVILNYDFNLWRFQPTEPVLDEGADVATFEDTRVENETPQEVGGDLKLATFNVLNYFNTTGEQFVLNGGSCTYYTDRDDNRIGNNTCTPDGPRGAATDVSFERQQAKIVLAINAMDADVVSLEELENSIKLLTETDRDDAIAALVDALNEDAGAGTWDYVASPAAALTEANVAEQDVIRNGFIYRTATVEPVGASRMLFGSAAFSNAREPLAQVFKPAGGPASTRFAVVVNHFKSKGCSGASGDNADAGDGQSCFNGDRTRQAEALVDFIDDVKAARGVERVFITGDLNSYTQEDPMQVLYDAGYEVVESDSEGDWSYSFSGLSGSLDHVLANDAAMAEVDGADVWEINANESVGYQYSRFNYNVTQLFDATDPFAASDHNPEIVGFSPVAGAVEVQVLGTNDFHGRILQNAGSREAGAAVLSGAVKQLREENPNTVFAAAGDLIGASTFESFIANDKPTIDALNEAGLDVSAVGNHELDQGYDDLVDRVMAEYDESTNPEGGAEWAYIAANLKLKATGDPAVPATWIKTMDGVEVGFVGAVTEDLPSLVSPSGIADVEVTDIVESVNAEAADLRAEGADVVVMLVHEGSASTDCASPQFTDEATTWGNITQNVSGDVDAIVSGHTHLAYNCSFPVAEWSAEDRAVTERPVVSAGRYGMNLNKLVFTVDPVSGEVQTLSQDLVALMSTDPDGSGPLLPTANFPADPAVTQIVADAQAEADVLGAEVLGQIEAPFNRAKLSNGTSENRGGESTLGNLVAEVQRWATEQPESGSAEIAFMNPGGLRADMVGTVNGDARDLTYKQAAVVQPFANTLINMDLTGEQIETVLEQQWQRTSAGAVPTRPFLRLGVSDGFTYTFVESPVTVQGTETFEGEVTGMWLDGEPIDPAASYSVTVNSFLASGGDNFFELANGTGKADTGKVDLAAMVDYMAEFGSESPVAVDYAQRAVEVDFGAEAPASYEPGDTVAFDVSSWSMSTADDVKDDEITVLLGDAETGVELGTAVVDNTVSDAVFDRTGMAGVEVDLPADAAAGDTMLTLVGAETGTETTVPITITAPELATPTIEADSVKERYGKPIDVPVTVSADGVTPTGTVTLTWGDEELGTATLVDGSATVRIRKFALEPRTTPYPLTVTYSGDGAVASGVGVADVKVAQALAEIRTEVRPDRIVQRRSNVRIVVRVVNRDGVEANGLISATLGNQFWQARVRDGEAVLRLGKFKAAGRKRIDLRFSNSDVLLPQRDQVTFRVVKQPKKKNKKRP